MQTEETVVNERVATELTTHDFWYDLPKELIAQEPANPRDSARRFRVDSDAGMICLAAWEEMNRVRISADGILELHGRPTPLEGLSGDALCARLREALEPERGKRFDFEISEE